MKPLIFLTGMPGAGKTWWGNRASSEFGLPFTDLDAYIEQQEKATIVSLFSNLGESRFRELEHHYLQLVVHSCPTPSIIACGGGTPCFKNNLEILRENGAVIYLRANIPFIFRNIQLSHKNRPLLMNQPDLPAYLETTLAARKSFYEKADFILDAENISLATFDKIIRLCTGRP